MIPVTIILPTYNERENLSKLLPVVKAWNLPLVVVDDNSPDGTCDIATAHGVHVILRKDQRGLGSAIREGSKYARTPYVAVMDTDGQHEPYELLVLIRLMDKYQGLRDVISGSRLMERGSIEGLPLWRKIATRFLNWLGGLKAQTKSSDYLTGMFVARTELVQNTSENGFKILYEILRNNKLRIHEAPITLHQRNFGESKASFKEIANYLKLVFS